MMQTPGQFSHTAVSDHGAGVSRTTGRSMRFRIWKKIQNFSTPPPSTKKKTFQTVLFNQHFVIGLDFHLLADIVFAKLSPSPSPSLWAEMAIFSIVTTTKYNGSSYTSLKEMLDLVDDIFSLIQQPYNFQRSLKQDLA